MLDFSQNIDKTKSIAEHISIIHRLELKREVISLTTKKRPFL